MEQYQIEILQRLREKRKTYLDMVKYCTEGTYILNNTLYPELSKEGYEFDNYCGENETFYDEDWNEIDREEAERLWNEEKTVHEEYDEIYQYFVIHSQDAEFFKTYTNELVIYCDELDLYLLCVKHYGTSWDYVPANWKELPKEE